MKAMVLEAVRSPLRLRDLSDPEPGPGEVRVRVEACAVCRTDLHVVDGDLSHPKLPLVPGHEIVGIVDRLGGAVGNLAIGERVGIPWLAHTCGHCSYCLNHQENPLDASKNLSTILKIKDFQQSIIDLSLLSIDSLKHHNKVHQLICLMQM